MRTNMEKARGALNSIFEDPGDGSTVEDRLKKVCEGIGIDYNSLEEDKSYDENCEEFKPVKELLDFYSQYVKDHKDEKNTKYIKKYDKTVYELPWKLIICQDNPKEIGELYIRNSNYDYIKHIKGLSQACLGHVIDIADTLVDEGVWEYEVSIMLTTMRFLPVVKTPNEGDTKKD